MTTPLGLLLTRALELAEIEHVDVDIRHALYVVKCEHSSRLHDSERVKRLITCERAAHLRAAKALTEGR